MIDYKRLHNDVCRGILNDEQFKKFVNHHISNCKELMSVNYIIGADVFIAYYSNPCNHSALSSIADVFGIRPCQVYQIVKGHIALLKTFIQRDPYGYKN